MRPGASRDTAGTKLPDSPIRVSESHATWDLTCRRGTPFPSYTRPPFGEPAKRGIFANRGTYNLSSSRGLRSLGSRTFVAALALTLVALLIYIAARRPVDFPVYHYGARHMLARSGPLYGPKSGIGWPQVYRYPPLFLVFFVPFALLPLRLAAVVWAALKFVVLGFLGQALFSRFRTDGLGLQLLSVLPALPYLAVEFHYGNVQFFIFALVAASFLWLEKQPVLAASILALAVSLKVWPLFFVPYLLARKRLLVGGLTLVLAAGLTLLPAAYFGWHGNASLLHQWAKEEFRVASTSGEPAIIGFPSQSLHSVLMRFLTSLDYARLTDSNYPKLNFANFDPRAIELLWVILAASGYMGLLVLARKATQSEELTLDSIAFCALLLLQPFTQIGDLVILLWPVAAAVAALYYDDDLPAWIRVSLYLALSMIVVKPLIPTREAQRFLQVAGIDFAALSLLTVALIGMHLRRPHKCADLLEK
jgi:Glycosyltransferase family 87